MPLFPTTRILDTFPNNGGPPPPGGNWTTLAPFAGLSVVGNELVAGAAVDSAAYWSAEEFENDQEVYIQITAIPAPGGLYLGVGYDVVLLNGYIVLLSAVFGGVDQIYFYRVDLGAPVQLGAIIDQEFAAGDWLGVSRVNSTITAYRSTDGIVWTPLGARADATYSGDSSIGVLMLGANQNLWALDNFGGGNHQGTFARGVGELEASQILVPDTGGEYKAYSLLLLTQRLLRATAGTGMAPHHFITQRGPLQDGDSPLDMRWDAGTLQLLIADMQCNRTDYFDARDALVRLLRPNRSFGWPDGVVRPLVFRKWLPMGRFEFGTDLVLTAGSNIVRSQTGRFVERGLDPGCTLTISSTVGDDGIYTIDDVPNDYTLQLDAAMVNAETGAHWQYMRRWGKRDLYCLLEEGPRFDEGPGPQPFTPNGYREALRFVANDPFWYGQEQSETWTVEAVSALVFDTDGTDTTRAWFGKVQGQGVWFFGADSVSEAVEVVYWGTVGAKPIITINGPATNPIITNNTTGEKLEMDYTVTAGETVTIDILAQTVTNNFSDNLQPFTTGDLATFELSPRPQAPNGVNVIHVSFGAGAVQSAVTMTWRNRYESLH